ncbi:DUF4367 domain-containing protein [Metallumcola ferriviriculae]
MLINNKGGKKTLYWHEQGIIYSIVGYYPAEEMIKIAESFSYREPK